MRTNHTRRFSTPVTYINRVADAKFPFRTSLTHLLILLNPRGSNLSMPSGNENLKVIC